MLTLEAKLTPYVITFLCLTGSALSFYSFYQDFHSVGDKGLGAPIGVIHHFETQVRRKTGRSFIWNDVEQPGSVFKKDSIKTGPKSSASITFKDDSKLEIGENSLIVLDDTKDLAANFREGNFTLRTAKEERHIEVKKNGKTEVRVIPVSLTRPLPFARNGIFESETIKFEWEVAPTSKNGDGASLDISTHKSFSEKDTVSHPVWISENTISIPVAPGTYYWRISQENHPLSKTAEFSVSKAKLPNLLSPVGIDLKTEEMKTKGIAFQWTALEWTDAQKAESKAFLEYATDASFKVGAHALPVSTYRSSFTVSELEKGAYFWRLKFEVGEKSYFTTPAPFTVLDSRLGVSLTTSEPKEGAELLFWETPPTFSFHWARHPLLETDSDGEYQLLLSTDKEFKNAVVEKTKANFIPSDTLHLAENDYFWKVQIKKGDEVLISSAPHHFRYAHFPPLRAPLSISSEEEVCDLAKVHDGFLAKWEPVEKAEKYEVTVKAKGKTVVTQMTEKTQLPLKDLSVGEYVWTVRAVDILKRSGAEFKPHHLKIIRTQLKAPASVQSEIE